jgi:hypothetical protein
MLFIQDSPNGGVLTAGLHLVVNGSPLDFTSVNGFDIPGRVRVATSNLSAHGLGYAVLNGQDLYSIALSTGTATLLGAIDSAEDLAGLALGEPGVTTIAFTDVPLGFFAGSSIGALVAAGITAGCVPGQPLYCPEAPVTREQMATVLSKVLGEVDPPVPAVRTE